jgi:hypothetical protein
LQDIVFKTISSPVRVISAAAFLDRTISSLDALHKTRNDLCEAYTKDRPTAQAYFGLRTDTAIDERYSTALRNIASYTDDALYVAKLAGDDLRKYALKLKSQLPGRLQERAPVIVSANYDKAKDIMPDPARYADWEKMFITLTKEEAKKAGIRQ